MVKTRNCYGFGDSLSLRSEGPVNNIGITHGSDNPFLQGKKMHFWLNQLHALNDAADNVGKHTVMSS